VLLFHIHVDAFLRTEYPKAKASSLPSSTETQSRSPQTGRPSAVPCESATAGWAGPSRATSLVLNFPKDRQQGEKSLCLQDCLLGAHRLPCTTVRGAAYFSRAEPFWH